MSFCQDAKEFKEWTILLSFLILVKELFFLVSANSNLEKLA